MNRTSTLSTCCGEMHVSRKACLQKNISIKKHIQSFVSDNDEDQKREETESTKNIQMAAIRSKAPAEKSPP
jgi:hypothetical protein